MIKDLPVVPSAKAGSMAAAPAGAAWREQHPVIGTACNQCLECTLFCPEGALVQTGGNMTVMLSLCNGCGICAVECRLQAIAMVREYTGVSGVFPLREEKV
ncbi:MAG: 2-oxoacid:ferredoxin oxidoreductase subunit alpha [Negativicutes bacterium]|nr:2-oxoacid:ferredoxin oxidoreductase subunit alpha [Negativicutes bacterium]